MPARKIVQIATGASGSDQDMDHVVYALAEDGCVWVLGMRGKEWKRCPDLPPAPACGANVDRKGELWVCELSSGHVGRHRSGGLGEF
jgi:hypothetical protein